MKMIFSKMKPSKQVKAIPYSLENLEIAKKEAFDEEYIFGEDDSPIIGSPTQLDRIEAQITYTAMMTDTLLEV